MVGSVRENISVRKGCRGTIFWPLVLYSLMQLASDLSVRDTYDADVGHNPINHKEVKLDSLHLSACVEERHDEYSGVSSNCDQLDVGDNGPSGKIRCENNYHHHHQHPTLARKQDENLCSSEKSSISARRPLLSTTITTTTQAETKPLLSSATTYLKSLLRRFPLSWVPADILQRTQQRLKPASNWASFFGAKILMAEASALYHPKQNREIIILNSSNFFPELVQYKHPFPHIKLVEYYVSFCGFCIKFKPTFAALSKEIQAWRNVIRISVIDYGVTSNSPISHSWPVEVVPTLRIHPPPSQQLAEKLQRQFSAWSTDQITGSELQARAYKAYNSSKQLVVTTMSITQVLDNVTLIKSQLLAYIENYARENPTKLPGTWPNLRPVAEEKLESLVRSHPRQELYLLIDAATQVSQSDWDENTRAPSAAFRTLMELSSGGAAKAVRYVRLSDNRALVEDVIANLKLSADQVPTTATEADATTTTTSSTVTPSRETHGESIQQLARQLQLLSGSNQSADPIGSPIYLVHVDGAHAGQKSKLPSSLVSPSELMASENFVLAERDNQLAAGRRARRQSGAAAAAVNDKNLAGQRSDERRFRRATGDTDSGHPAFDKLSEQRRIELIASYVSQQYVETREDREFVRALENFDELSRQDESAAGTEQQVSKPMLSASDRYIRADNETGAGWSIGTDLIWELVAKREHNSDQQVSNLSQYPDYEDKLKAIRYMFFSEIPRRFNQIAGKENAEMQSKRLSNLLDLVSVLQAYFPLSDSRSVAFLEGLRVYLVRQERRLAGGQPASFDSAAFKRELKKLETDGKTLPEIQSWRLCKCGGYPCALWRLFHTLTVFEFEKLSQIRLPSQQQQQQQQLNNNHNHQPQDQPTEMPTEPAAQSSRLTAGDPSLEPPSSTSAGLPVEHLVSPPSTTSSMALTIAAPTVSNSSSSGPVGQTELAPPVLLVMRDYITNFFSCDECAKHFRQETADLSLARIRHQEPAEFSVLWLWQTHNRVNKRLSVAVDSNPLDHPKVWFPTFEQCPKCYRRPPSFLADASQTDPSIFRESIEWDRPAVLGYLVAEYSRHPLDGQCSMLRHWLWGQTAGYLLAGALVCWLLILALRLAGVYVERQRRHKATLLNGASTGYSLELQ